MDTKPRRPPTFLITSPGCSTTSWNAELTNDEKRDIIDHIKAAVTTSLAALSGRRLREQPHSQWQTAYAYRGGGSTRDRRNTVESIYSRWVPIPTSVGDPDAEEFLDDVKSKVIAAIDNVRQEVEAQRAQTAKA